MLGVPRRAKERGGDSIDGQWTDGDMVFEGDESGPRESIWGELIEGRFLDE
jgi:hypothetical protein